MTERRTRWTLDDDAALMWAYAKSHREPSPELLARHSLLSCRQRAHKIGIARVGGPLMGAERFSMDVRDAAYLAALIDGEGYVSGTAKKPVKIDIATTDYELAEWVVRKVPVMKIHVRKERPGRKQAYSIRCQSLAACAEVARHVLPYLVINRKADAMREFTTIHGFYGRALTS